MSEVFPAPTVSILVPAFNAAPWLPGLVSAVQEQTRGDWELIIVNDGSTDHTAAVIASHQISEPRLRTLTQANAGLCAARNAAMALADTRSRFFLFLDADDLLEPAALEILVQALERSPQCIASHGLGRYVDAEGDLIEPGRLETYHQARWGVSGDRLRRWAEDEPTTWALFASGDHTSVGAQLIRREIFAQTGPWDITLKGWEDWDMWWRTCEHGDWCFVPEFVMRYRRHGSNMSLDSPVLWASEQRAWAKFLHHAHRSGDPARAALAASGWALRERFTAHLLQEWSREAWYRGAWCAALRLRLASLRSWVKWALNPNPAPPRL
jgi:glycosyltransferase involved in cell wall biosynthesis